MKPVGLVLIHGAEGLKEVEAFRIGKFWAVNRFQDGSPHYSVTHKATGKRLIGGIGFRHARKLVGVCDVLFPTNDEKELSSIWYHQIPSDVRKAIVKALTL